MSDESTTVVTDDEPAAGAGASASLGPRHQAVAALLAQLAATGRAFLLYDAHNDTVRRALGRLLEALAAALAAAPRLCLVVRPFEIEFENERVYLDRDRERSLAFRLYRDGVRTLTLHEGLDASELGRLLEILSLRYGGIHQYEDDTVTLLWKAALRHLDVVAVEGLAPESEGAAAEASTVSRAEPRPYLPEDAEAEFTAPANAVTPEWVDVADGASEEARAEVAAAAVGGDCLQLVGGLVRALFDPKEGMQLEEAVPLFEEIRDFLIGAGTLVELVEFVRQLQQLARNEVPWDERRHELAVGLVLSCGSDRAVRRLLHSVPDDERVLKPELLELLDVVCSDPLTAVAESLAVEERPAGRAIARQLLEHYGRRRTPHLRQRFDGAKGRAAADLLRSLARLEGAGTGAFLALQCGHPDAEVREEALWHLERTEYSGSLGHGLIEAVRKTEGDHRRRVLALVERSRDRRFVKPLVALVDSHRDEPAEAAEVARVIGRLEGDAGVTRWRHLLTPKGRFFRRSLPGPLAQQVAAVVAVAQAPGEEAAQLLRLALSAANRELRPWIEIVLEGRGERQARLAS